MSTQDAALYLERTYGMPRPLPKNSLLDYGRAVLLVVGADGTITDAEMRAWLAIGRAMGGTDEMLEAWRTFDFKSNRLEDCIPGISSDPENPGEITAAFLYDAIRVARADGAFSEPERAAVARAARTLNIPLATVAALEKLIEAEESLRALRISLLYPSTPRFPRGAGSGGLR